MSRVRIPAIINNTQTDEEFNIDIMRAQRLIEDAIIILSTMTDSQGLELASPSFDGIIQGVNSAIDYLHKARTGVPYISQSGGIRRYPAGEVK